MKGKETWKPSKFVYRNGKLAASRNPGAVAVGSRLSADIVASYYDTYIRRYARGRLLDLGCGRVPLFGAYRDFVTENICVDWDNSAHKNEHLDLECDLTKTLPFASGEFNTIILSDVLEHIAEPLQLWSEMSRVLTGGGRIIMNVPFYYWLHEQPHDYYRYTEFSLRRFAEATRMNIVLLTAVGGVPEIIGDMVAKTIVQLPHAGKSLAALTQHLTSIFIRTGVGRKVSERTRNLFPLGYFLVVEKRS
jgi:SAM-dependent methyltransferase